MLRVYDVAVTFSEFPDEIALCANITGCILNCPGCSEPWLKPADTGDELTEPKIDDLIAEHLDITVFGLMGGDNDHDDCIRIADYIHNKYPGMKVGIYSGRDFINMELAQHMDYYKIGRWIQPDMKHPETWKDKTWGPLVWPVSNQLLFERQGNKLVNVTYKFRQNPINDWSRYIIVPENDNDR